MPFTISHTAVVLPFSRWLARWQLLSAATIGAMVPDFRVFFPSMPRWETHSITALFTFCLPVGLITYWVFQRLIKSPILEVLPEGPYARCGRSRRKRIFTHCGNGCWPAAASWREP
jgi:hypothetical protein